MYKILNISLTFFEALVDCKLFDIKAKVSNYWNYCLKFNSEIIYFNFVKCPLWCVLKVHYGVSFGILNFKKIIFMNIFHLNKWKLDVLLNLEPNEYIVLV